MAENHIGRVREVNDDGTVTVELNDHGIETVLERKPALFDYWHHVDDHGTKKNPIKIDVSSSFDSEKIDELRENAAKEIDGVGLLVVGWVTPNDG